MPALKQFAPSNPRPLFLRHTSRMTRRFLFLLSGCLLSALLSAQSPAGLRLDVSPADAPLLAPLLRKWSPTPKELPGGWFFPAPDTLGGADMGQRLIRHLQDNTYLGASLDSFQRLDARNARARLFLGPPMYWVALRPAPGAADAWLDAAGFRQQLFRDRPLRYDAFLRIRQKILEQAENNGYPFAALYLDSIAVRPDGGVSAVLRVQRNRYFTIKTLRIVGDLRLPAGYLPNYLGLRPGAPYNRARVLRLRERLDDLPFAERTGDPTVTFAGDQATVNLFLRKKRAGRFDFIIGLLPQPNDPDGRLLLTGSLNAAFQNALNLGERLSVEFERLRPETQKLDAQAALPYVFGLPFGVEGRLGVFRRDSSWVDAQGQLGVQYFIEGNDFVSFFWEKKSSSLQKIDTLGIIATRRLPAVLDLRQNGFGLETGLSRLDYRFNPRKGWALSLRGVAGFNTVQRNPTIEALSDPADPAFSFATLYDSVAGRVARFRLDGQAACYLPLAARTTVKLGLRGGGIFSEKPVFVNEQYRLGGNKLLRGFDEESLFATRFVVATAEIRLLLARNSFIAAFTDYGYLENLTDRNRLFLRPWGLGAGLNFETSLGIFGINIAFGRRDTGQSIDWRAAKFHLGYVSLF